MVRDHDAADERGHDRAQHVGTAVGGGEQDRDPGDAHARQFERRHLQPGAEATDAQPRLPLRAHGRLPGQPGERPLSAGRGEDRWSPLRFATG